jgi:hypothetical protein
MEGEGLEPAPPAFRVHSCRVFTATEDETWDLTDVAGESASDLCVECDHAIG